MRYLSLRWPATTLSTRPAKQNNISCIVQSNGLIRHTTLWPTVASFGVYKDDLERWGIPRLIPSLLLYTIIFLPSAFLSPSLLPVQENSSGQASSIQRPPTFIRQPTPRRAFVVPRSLSHATPCSLETISLSLTAICYSIESDSLTAMSPPTTRYRLSPRCPPRRRSSALVSAGRRRRARSSSCKSIHSRPPSHPHPPSHPSHPTVIRRPASPACACAPSLTHTPPFRRLAKPTRAQPVGSATVTISTMTRTMRRKSGTHRTRSTTSSASPTMRDERRDRREGHRVAPPQDAQGRQQAFAHHAYIPRPPASVPRACLPVCIILP